MIEFLKQLKSVIERAPGLIPGLVFASLEFQIDEAIEQAKPRSMDTAPKDGKMVRLLIDYTDGGSSLEDEIKGWTIGFNNDDNVGEDEGQGWQFVGWNWCHEVFNNGTGKVLAWLPWENPKCEN